MSKPKIPPTAYGYSLWKQYSMKDVHVRYFAYTFKEIQEKHIKDQDEPGTEKFREEQKFAYDALKRELTVTFSGDIQSGVVDVLIAMMRESIKGVVDDEDVPQFHTNAVSRLFQSPADRQERYRLVGDALVTTGLGPVFAIETATRHSLPSIKDKIKKWFLLPSITGVLLVHLNEGNGYWKPTSRPPNDEVFLINSWAWLNYIMDINDEKIDLFDCSKPVEYGGHVWVGSLTCVLELYEPDFASKRSHCAATKRYEFIVPGRQFNLETSEEREAFEQHFSKVWTDAVDGDSLLSFQPFVLNWRRLAECVAKTRLQLAYDRYKAWFKKYSKPRSTSTSLGKRRREGTASQEVFYAECSDPFDCDCA